MNKKITAAAIRLDNGLIISLPAPARHHNIIQLLADLKIYSDMQSNGNYNIDSQGFLTSDGNFADRTQAAAMAIECGQIKGLRWPPYLYSEDLW